MLTKTIKQTLENRFPEWFIATENLFNEVTAFYFGIIKDHEFMLELSNKEALTKLEKLTHKTKDNPLPPFLLEKDVPAMFRRACINTALGSARSFISTLNKWRKHKAKAESRGKKFTERPPVPPREWRRKTIFYSGQHKDYQGTGIMLKLYDGNTWRWVKYRLTGRKVPDGWNISCPHAVIKEKRVELHIPIEKEKPRTNSIKKQILQPHFRICAVDLNIGDRLAVCAIYKSDGTQVATRFIRGGDDLNGRRKRLLGMIATKRSLTGTLTEGERDNKRLWGKINNIDDCEAHRVSRRIVDFAREHGAGVLVFEHLDNFRPVKDKYSRRANSKRSYWLRGRIFRYARYKAWEHGIIASRVSPKNTSRKCSACGSDVARYGEGDSPEGCYRPGAPLFACRCGNRGNADLNAARNIAQKLLARYAA